LDKNWSDWFDGFTLEYMSGDTILTGRVADQAALHGILSRIGDLGLSIELVEHVNICKNTSLCGKEKALWYTLFQ